MAPFELPSEAVSWAHVRTARLFSRLAIASLVCMLALTYGGHRTHDPLVPALGIGCMVVTLTALAASFLTWFRRKPRAGALLVSDEAVAIRQGGTTTTIARGRITSAYVVRRFVWQKFVATVELELAGGDVIAVELENDDVAQRTVSALGFGAGQRRIHIALGAPARRLIHLPLGLAAYYIGSLAMMPFLFLQMSGGDRRITSVIGLAMGIAMISAYAFLRRLARAAELTIGDDGLLFTAGFKRRFIPRGAIKAVEQQAAGLPLVVHAGAQSLVVRGAVLDIERRAAAARIAYERFAVASPGQGGTSQFARGGRTVAAWKEFLRQRLGSTGYREAASPAEEAAAALASAHATAEERAGAALMLRIAGEPPPRIRIAASASADDGLRAALEAIAETDDDVKLERALRKLR